MAKMPQNLLEAARQRFTILAPHSMLSRSAAPACRPTRKILGLGAPRSLHMRVIAIAARRVPPCLADGLGVVAGDLASGEGAQLRPFVGAEFGGEGAALVEGAAGWRVDGRGQLALDHQSL